MKIYIASPYIAQREINQFLYEELSKAGNDVFLPQSINKEAITEEEKKEVSETCYSQIDNSDLLLVVYPFGISVACEAGYTICRKMQGNNRKIVLYSRLKTDKIYNEAMFIPYVDYETDNMDELIRYINQFNS